MSAVHRQELRTLQPGTQNALVIGVIINSFNMKTIDTSRMRFNNGERGVWTFTLRDSRTDFINVTVWGSVEFVKNLSSTFHIGSVVEVINPKVMARRMEDKNELFVPSVSSACSLTVNESNALVQIHDAPTRPNYERLLPLPVRSCDGLRSLKNVLENLEALRDQYVDVLIVVTFISRTRDIMTRDGRSIRCRNFEAADASTDEIISFVLWENEWIERAGIWEPKRTVLFLSDARIGHDNFRKKTVLSIVRKTLITENPDIPQARAVRDSVRSYEQDVHSDNPLAIPNPDTIATVMTIQQISDKLNKKTKPGERVQFATILKAYVMELNVDSTNSTIILTRCALCKKIVRGHEDSCMNLDCPSGNGSRAPLNVVNLNLKMNLKDKTGYLVGCRLIGEVAESAMECTVAEFQAMTHPQRADLKWKFILEKCEVRLHILGPTSTFPSTVYNILSIRRIVEEDEDTENEPQNRIRFEAANEH